MELAPVGVPVTCEVTFDSPSLNVGMSVYDVTNSSTLISGPTAMTLVAGNTYQGKTPDLLSAHSYVVIKAVYTDNSLTTLSPDYSQGSESLYAQDAGGGGGGSTDVPSVVGLIDNYLPVVGYVNC